eukprot:403350680
MVKIQAYDDESYDQIMNVNLKAQFFLIKEAHYLLKKSQRDANILVNASIFGKSPDKYTTVYSMSKAGLINMVKSLAMELMPDNIRVNAIGPGFIKTAMTDPLQELMKQKGKKPDPKIVGEPHQIAGIVAMMCSEDGSFVNGETYFAQGLLGKI